MGGPPQAGCGEGQGGRWGHTAAGCNLRRAAEWRAVPPFKRTGLEDMQHTLLCSMPDCQLLLLSSLAVRCNRCRALLPIPFMPADSCPNPRARPSWPAAGRKRKSVVVESDSEGQASGSEYAASDEEEESEEESLADSEEERSEEEDSGVSPAKKRRGGGGGGGKAKGRKPAAGRSKGKQAKATATPVALPNGSVGLTPGSRLTGNGGLPGLAPTAARTGGGMCTAARPPRPASAAAKTPGTAGTVGSLARPSLLAGTPLTGGAAGEESGTRQAAAVMFQRAKLCSECQHFN